VRADLGVPAGPGQREEDPGRDDPAGAELVGQVASQADGDGGAEALGGEQQPGLERAAAAQDLEVQR
jgi:hypothetical protein